MEVRVGCSEHISLRKDREKRNTASEKECPLLTAERSLKEDARKAEPDSHTNKSLS